LIKKAKILIIADNLNGYTAFVAPGAGGIWNAPIPAD